jgi:hypothetical protein
MLLADVSAEQGPQDPFKVTFVKQRGLKDFADKALTKNLITHGKAERKGHKTQTNWRWTEVQNRYKAKDRIFDKVV